jgi:hypothetical protein
MKDGWLFLLLALHFLSFLCLHTKPGRKIMQKYKRNPYRMVIQQTFKGYGKGIKLIALVEKGVEMCINPLYFCAVICVRCSVAALYKTLMLGFFLKKEFRFRKIRDNLKMNGIPTLLLFIIYYNKEYFENLHFIF